MKLKHISSLLLFLFVFGFAAYSQVEDEEVQIFNPNGTRSIGTKQELDFGFIKKDAKIIKVEVQNSGKADMKVGRIAIPEGIGVIVLNEIIKPGEKGAIAIMVDPKYLKSGKFKKDITLSTVTEDNGAMVTKTVVFSVKGEIQ